MFYTVGDFSLKNAYLKSKLHCGITKKKKNDISVENES